MQRSVQLGREPTRWWSVAILAPLFFGCNLATTDPGATPTPVATPIVVGTPAPTTATPSPDLAFRSQEERKETIDKVSDAIQAARKNFPGNTAVHFIDIESDLSLDFDGDKKFESASLMKLVVIAEVYRRVQIGELELDRTLTLKPEQIVGGSGDLQHQEPGMTFPVKVLVEKMITQSDNTATQMLTDFLTRDALNKSTKNLGLSGTTIDRDIYDFAAIDRGRDNYITAKDAAKLMAELAREELPGSSDIHAILERQQRNDMIGKDISPDVRIAHKTGELNGILHDVGVVYAPRGAYVLALLSDHVTDKQKAVEVWASLSSEILALYQTSPTPAVP